MPTPTSNGHASRVQIQEPRTMSPLPPSSSPIAFKEQQGSPPPAVQQTITGKLFRNLFKGLLFSQLTLISLLVIVLTIRGLIAASSHHFHPKKWYPPLLASVAVSGVASLAWQCIFIYNPSRAVKATFWLSPILTCSVGILLVLIGSAVDAGIGAVFVLFAITQSLYGCWITPRFEYTDKILSLATAFPPARTREVVCLSIFVSVVYSGFLVTGIGGATSTRTNLDLLFITVIVISLAWTMQVLKNVQQVAISRARYVNFAHGEDMDAWDAFRITVKHLIGSICIGSTLVPIIVFIRGSIRSVNLMSGSSDEVMYSGADCFSTIANKLITVGNRWGFVHVGTYDKGFMEASSDTWKKFRSTNGLEKVIDSDLTSSFCFLSAVSVGAVSSLTAGIWVLLINKDNALEVTLYGFIIGYFVGRVALAWIQACVLAYYVAYSEDPQSMRFDGTIPHRIQRLQMLSAHRDNREIEVAEMAKCSPPPTLSLSKYAPLIHVMKVHPSKVYFLIGSGGKKVKSIIEESGVEAIDMQDDGTVKIMANDVASLERAKAIISGLTMVPAIGDIYRNCEIKSMAPYGAFVEIAPGREGLCHISELSAEWLAKPEDAFKVGDRIDVKLIEVNEKGQLRLSVRALLPESETDKDSQKQQPTGDSTKDQGSPRKYVNTSSKDRAAPAGASKVASGDELVLKKKDVRRATGGSSDKTMKSNSSSNEEERSSLVNGEATIS